MIVAPLVASLVQMAVSRQREYLADATGALTGNITVSNGFDQIVAPTLRQKNPDARRTAAQTLANLSATSRKFKQALLRTNLRDHLHEDDVRVTDEPSTSAAEES